MYITIMCISIMYCFFSFQKPLPFELNQLRKFFLVGDHVKVVAGRHEGETGIVVRIENNLAILFADLTMHEVTTMGLK